MSEERKYYVLCADNCKFEAMTKEQIIAAIVEATGNTPTKIDDAFITKIKEQNKGKGIFLWLGTTAEYNAIETKRNDCIYIKTDDTTTEEANKRISTLEKKVDAAEAQLAKRGVVLFEGMLVVYNKAITINGISKYSAFIIECTDAADEEKYEIFCAATSDGYIKGGSCAYKKIVPASQYTEFIPERISNNSILLELNGDEVIKDESMQYLQIFGECSEDVKINNSGSFILTITKITGLY